MKEIKRPVFPKKAVITAGMPYGNKELHFGHVGGVFIPADIFARFLRDRIGKDNVVFVSGTDCYGSPIATNYRELVEKKDYEGTIEDYVRNNHDKQKEALDNYDINLNLYATSALGRSGEIHKRVSEDIFNKLYDNGYLVKMSTPQFYDPDFDVLLNGRQVIGKCPINGCGSDKAYADECSLGHMYSPSELIDPKSTLSGKTPKLKEVTNWYYKLEDYMDALKGQIEYLDKNTYSRKYLLKTIEEFLKPPMIYVKRKDIEDLDELVNKLPKHNLIDEPKKPSLTFEFDSLDERDKAKDIMKQKGLHFRTGKTLVPFRLTGNIDWGIDVPVKESLDNLTFWVWPESLWAPLSFTKTYLESIGKGNDEWKKYWLSEDSKVYQFIGEDNIYFYGIAEMGMFLSLIDIKSDDDIDWNKINLPYLIPNNHVLFMDKKASSSSDIKPPMANELLNYYTAEQLRMHFLSLGLAKKSVSFMPQVYLPDDQKVGPDPVLKDGNLLTNVFNRLIRSCFYTSQKHCDSIIPKKEISKEIIDLCNENILQYENYMYRHEFHRVVYLLDSFIRNLNKYWSKYMKQADTEDNQELRLQTLADCFHGVRVALTLVHPIAPSGCEVVREFLNVNENIWNWDYIFDAVESFIDGKENHKLKFLEPKTDFFKKHESQFRKK
ncbi:class I tRNA ligase family protein [Clostridiaceae bacterium M8S5]|nr:class I tRNA ligase family protein [Clostridiaceae bacterium M8S5]